MYYFYRDVFCRTEDESDKTFLTQVLDSYKEVGKTTNKAMHQWEIFSNINCLCGPTESILSIVSGRL